VKNKQITVLQKIGKLAVGLLLGLLFIQAVIRIIRYFYKFPMPEFLANAIDNPFRRRIQPPSEMPFRHGIQPGMDVLEIGLGNGRYTLETAQWVGKQGSVTAIDIEPRMIERVKQRALLEGVTNVIARVASVYDLPFEDSSFDALYMITVISEIPEPLRAIREFQRVLKPGGTLAFSEVLLDPDYPRQQTLERLATSGGFRLKQRRGNFFAYTLVFEKL
jgi:ubiquinone/menaquinone biosynthesis C-methylase UbiE